MREILLVLIMLFTAKMWAENPKREFRGAWLHTVGQNHFAARTTEQNKEYLRDQLDKMQQAGINAVIFQVRPVADAFYPSEIEPWSAYLTGESGIAPADEWDPLDFMIDECHSRGMELHAWLNPYRSVQIKDKVQPNHSTRTEPWRYITFSGRYYFDPGLPENRKLINDIVKDIVSRYDIDAIHMDDYFYPYPVKGVRFNDDKSFAKYGNGKPRNDWRRENVNKLIKELSSSIHGEKPWVRFGISPFGIWRNIGSDPKGSNSRGLQNYDDLYADVILWAKEGWIDYQAPQLYWELEHRAAPSGILADWWNANAYGRHMYFGQDVERTMNSDEFDKKMEISRRLPNVQGNVWWPSVSVTGNYKDVAKILSEGAQSTVALTPEYPWLACDNDRHIAAPRNLSIDDGVLSWEFPLQVDDNCPVSCYAGTVIYKLSNDNDTPDKLNAESILGVVRGEDNFFILGDDIPEGTSIAVTALDRINRESGLSHRVVYHK